ncbi:hypothetical protein ACLK2I_13805 [Escherichia coli]
MSRPRAASVSVVVVTFVAPSVGSRSPPSREDRQVARYGRFHVIDDATGITNALGFGDFTT